MQTLTKDLRRTLENTVREARDTAEEGARKALDQLGVADKEVPGHLSDAERKLRKRLRAHARQLGDRRRPDRGQDVDRLVSEIAYEHWHRMLFARFLAEAGLLIEPQHELPLSLDDVRELARESGADWLDLAASYAERMLPQIFRSDDPALAVTMPREVRSDLEDLLKQLPAAVFRADDSLGWVYQFWQADEKKRVNESQVKIGADELPAVTQLFTEDYMVLFLLHNTLGAWWAGKVLADDPDLARSAPEEDALRRACALPGVDWTYLRFVRDAPDGEGSQEPGPWRPAAGTFHGWPTAARDVTLLDPCMGSGHFLVFALPILVAMRQAEEGLDLEAAVKAVLRDNLFGLEIDQRCTQLAAFNLAFAAWRMIGHVAVLPPLNLACSGLSIGVSKQEWMKLADRAVRQADPAAKQDMFGSERTLLNSEVETRMRNGLERMYDTFAQAPTLGSLIDPRQTGGDIFAADYEALAPLVREAFVDNSHEVAEMAVTARGISRAEELLSQSYTLVSTNVPFLTKNKQSSILQHFLSTNHKMTKNDLATAMVERCLKFAAQNGTVNVVTPQNWYFLGTFKKFRGYIVAQKRIEFLLNLGSSAFADMNWWAMKTALTILSQENTNDADYSFSCLDFEEHRNFSEKANLLKRENLLRQNKSELFENPDFRFVFGESSSLPLLANFASSFQGISPADAPKYSRCFWEITRWEDWYPWQSTVNESCEYGGREYIFWWNVDFKEAVTAGSAYIRGEPAWGKNGVAVRQIGSLPATIYTGEIFDTNCSAIIPKNEKDLLPIWCFISSNDYWKSVRRVDQKMNVTNATLVKVPFDIEFWRKVAQHKYPQGLPAPYSDDPTQWLFCGNPKISKDPLQVAVARLVGYEWPRQRGYSFTSCPAIEEPDGLQAHAGADGIVCLNAVQGEESASDRLRKLLRDAYGNAWSPRRLDELLQEHGQGADDLHTYLRDKFFARHLRLFQQRPFVWHVWDGRKDGFHALVNYHRLAGADGLGGRTLDKLVFTYLREWIDRQQGEVDAGEPGAEARLAAARHLSDELKKIREGEPPYDLFIRWKPLHRQPIGWEPDVNDGVRLNIRPFLTARPWEAGRKNECILREPPNIKLDKADRGTEPARPREDFPWFYSWDGKTLDFMGGKERDGKRWNALHYSRAAKQAARDRKANRAAE